MHRRLTIVIFCSTLILSWVFIHSAAISNAQKREKNNMQILQTYQEDVTGNGLKERIQLKGSLFSPESKYYQTINTTIQTKDNNHWTITYDGGYDPTLTFIDLNHDRIADIFFQSATGGSGGIYQSKLHTLAANTLTEIPLPKLAYVSGEFQDNFSLKLSLFPQKEPFLINAKNRADEYIRLGLYNKKGKLLKKQNLMFDPIAFYEPIFINKEKGYGLKSYQQVSGAYHADQLGTIETIWYYDNNKWINLKTEWLPSK
ncbi:hypothetical protein [Virgibacillus sp. MG-45]|uniref:hypothetical protein n=1 Tax=Virgibacillus sp. MG-45 TaxID=3102791 RepID=UPI002ED8ECD2